jgi:hypothetical protein
MDTLSPDLERFLRYLQFKMECAAYQEQNPLTLDMDRVLKNIEELEGIQSEKVEQLKQVMPKVPKTVKRNKPKVMFKKTGELSANGKKWLALLREHKLPPTHEGPVEVVQEYVDPNPNSTDQVKSWLHSLSWKPCTFKYVREADGSERKIEQVRKDGELTHSVVNLKDKAPEVEILEGLTVVQHRLGIFKGFRDSAIQECYYQRDETVKGGIYQGLSEKTCFNYKIKAEIGGLTNTLRFKHKKPLVNLPGVDREWGEEIRGCLIAPDGYEVVGADMVSLEDTTKRHYMQPLDPDYVEEMSQPGYDPHLSLALFAGGITQEQYNSYGETKDPEITAIRKAYKVTNYSAVYGVGAPKLSREMGISTKRAKELLEAYWKKNWSVKKIAQQQYVKKVGGLMWLKNPVSGIYHELRYDKDRFSTLNQSTGVYIFDSWLARCRVNGYMGVGQFHDETVGLSPIGKRDETTKKMEAAIDKLNTDLKLNVTLSIDVQFGNTYAEVHG